MKEEVKKKPAKKEVKNEAKKENKAIKVLVLVVIIIASVILGWLFARLPDGKCDVTFKLGNGLEDIVMSVTENGTVLKPSNPEKEGYVFEGWYHEGVKYDFTKPVTSDITLTAIWTEKHNYIPVDPVAEKYTVIFNTDGGNAVESQIVEQDKTAVEPTTPTKSGYVFAGWYLNDAKYDFNSKVTANITLTAKWTKEETKTETKQPTTTKYTVTFNSNGGSKVSSRYVEKGKTVSKPSNPTRKGYTFLGWYLNGSKFNFSTKINGNITLVAKWQKVDVITWTSVKVEGALYPQVRIYIVKNGKYVAGTADFVDSTGKVVRKSVPASGKVEPAGTVVSLKNITVN